MPTLGVADQEELEEVVVFGGHGCRFVVVVVVVVCKRADEGVCGVCFVGEGLYLFDKRFYLSGVCFNVRALTQGSMKGE